MNFLSSHYHVFLSFIIVIVVTLLHSTTHAENWAGEIDLEITNRKDFKWSVQVTITNTDARVATGFVVQIILQHEGRNALTLSDETNFYIDDSRAQRAGVWGLRSTTDFGLSGSGAHTSDYSFKIDFSRDGPLYGSCMSEDLLTARVMLMAEECTESSCGDVCGDGICSASETCTGCPYDCINDVDGRCPETSSSDTLCSSGETSSSTSACHSFTCLAPFRFLGLSTIDIVLIVATLAVLIIVFFFTKKFKRASSIPVISGDANSEVENNVSDLKRVGGHTHYESDDISSGDSSGEHDEDNAQSNEAQIPKSNTSLKTMAAVIAEKNMKTRQVANDELNLDENLLQNVTVISTPNIFQQRPWLRNIIQSPEAQRDRCVVKKRSIDSVASDDDVFVNEYIGAPTPRIVCSDNDMNAPQTSRVPDYLQDVFHTRTSLTMSGHVGASIPTPKHSRARSESSMRSTDSIAMSLSRAVRGSQHSSQSSSDLNSHKPLRPMNSTRQYRSIHAEEQSFRHTHNASIKPASKFHARASSVPSSQTLALSDSSPLADARRRSHHSSSPLSINGKTSLSPSSSLSAAATASSSSSSSSSFSSSLSSSGALTAEANRARTAASLGTSSSSALQSMSLSVRRVPPAIIHRRHA